MALTVQQRQALNDKLVHLCELAKLEVNGGHQYKATIILRAPHLPDGDVIVTEDSAEGISGVIARGVSEERL